MADEQEISPLKRALFALKDMRAKLDAVERARTEPIAVIGIGCRFPGGADTADDYWRLLRDGVNAVREVPPERWDVDAFYDPDPDAPGKMNTRWGAFLESVDGFEPQFFGITPREAISMDPQQRLLLEVAWEALEYAGIAPDSLAATRTGVYVGIAGNEYQRLNLEARGQSEIDAYLGTGGAASVAVGRISYVLGLRGPNLAVDTACSSSLVAVHLAVQSLRAGQSDIALAGGVNLMLSPEATITLSKVRALSPDSRCKTFDADADGYVRGEGCGIVVLKRLSDALAAGDTVLAVIRGSAVNHDGRSSGLTVPSGPAQQEVIRAALADAGDLDPLHIGFVEAHGTGTPLGDPIEVRALAAVLGKNRPAERPLLLGSVKTNIGHLEAAAGIAGLIKVVLSLHHGELPPHLHLQTPSPHIAWDTLPVRVVTERTPWNDTAAPPAAAVSAFGFSGTNAHVVLEQAPAVLPDSGAEQRPRHLLTLSAKSEAALRDLAGRTARHLAVHPELDPADVCFSLYTGRAHFAHRLAVSGANTAQLAEQLSAIADGQPGTAMGVVPAGARPQVAFLFTGQGAQYAGMSRRLYETQPAFRAALDTCAALINPHLDRPLLEVIFDSPDGLLDQTAYTQPALFAVEYALAMLWRSWGITPVAVLGHSVGEYTAAVIAEVISLEDAAALITARGRLMQALPPGGAMAAIFAAAPQVQAAVAYYADELAIAALNGPEHTVISGAVEAVEAVMNQFAAAGVRVQRLTVSHAFHSPLMEPILGEFEQLVAKARLQAPRLTLISNLSGEAAGTEVTTPAYWRRHVREAVRFGAGVEALRHQGIDICIEIGPHPTLLGMAQQAAAAQGEALFGLPSLRRGRDDWQQLLESLGALYVRAFPIDWHGLEAGAQRRKLALPTYAFQRARYWIAPPAAGGKSRSAPAGIHPLLGRRSVMPALRQTLFETQVSVQQPAYLADHVVYGATVFPGAAYLEMALAAAQAEGIGNHAVTLTIHAPLMLADDADTTLQLAATPDDTGARAIQIISFGSDAPERWTQHAVGAITPADTQPPTFDLAEIQTACTGPMDAASYYADLAATGLAYGPAFRGVQRLYRGDGASLGFVRLPDAAGGSAAYRLHPALLDACLHVIGAAMPDVQRTDPNAPVYVPVKVSGLQLYGTVPDAVWCAVRLAPGAQAGAPAMECNLTLFAEDGRVVAQLARLELRQAPRIAWGRRSAVARIDPWFHRVVWRARPRPADAVPSDPGDWLIVADDAAAAQKLVGLLQSHGNRCTVAAPGVEPTEATSDAYRIDLHDPHALRTILARPPEQRFTSVVGLWTAATPTEQLTLDSLWADQRRSVGLLLHLVQALAEASVPPRLWIVTAGAQPVDGDGTPLQLADATLWGFGRTVARELPALRTSCVDLEWPWSVAAIECLVEELLAPTSEEQIALRGTNRLVARLVQEKPAEPLAGGQPYRLNLPKRGVLDLLEWQPLEARTPGPGEIAIRVYASGLNFRDVLNVLGMYPGDPGPPGLECAGVVTAVGEDVTEFQAGDAVVALAPRGFDAIVITRAVMAARKPEHVSFAEAVTLPSTYLTAYHGLRNLANLQPGERVLIHAAAGGVGLAAVQIARSIGAEIFATAGSPAKHAFLRSLGVQHIFSSRTADFLEPILELTDGHGVDVVLNALSDEFISSSFAVLAPRGRFLEIGKRGIWSAEQAAAVRPQALYAPFDLSDVLRDTPDVIRHMMHAMVQAMSAGSLNPLPLRAFPAEAISDAFRFMAQARHIGKVVVTHQPARWAGRIRPDGAYLVTGGLGGLGLRVGAWLAEQGARHLVLLGRRGPSEAAAATIRAMQAAGATVQTLAADVADAAGLKQALAQVPLPIYGVFHAAGVLDDGVLAQQTWERFERVLAPKLAGAWNLHQATNGMPIEHFVLFSSAAGLLGNPGQSNYAAANVFLDALAHQRRAQGLPALSIDWGAWAEVGMAAGLGNTQQNRSAGRGVELIAPEQGLLALERAIDSGEPQSAVLPVRWDTLLQQFPAGVRPSLLSELGQEQARPLTASGADDPAEFRQRIAAAAPAERAGLLADRLALHMARVMGLGASESPERQRPLNELGLDSLMAVELKNRIDADLQSNIAVVTLLNGPTIIELAGLLASQSAAADGDAQVETTVDTSSPEHLLANLDQLSDSEVEALLGTMMNTQKEHS